MLVRFAQWGSLIIIYIRRLGFKILNFNIFVGFQKINIFWGYEDFVDILWAHHKTGLFFFFLGGGAGGARFKSFNVFKVNVQNENIFVGC